MARMRGRGGAAAETLGRWMLGPVLGRRAATAAEILAAAPQRVLVVRPHDQIGDLVCATSDLSALRRRFPSARLHVVCAPRQEPVLRHHPDLDGVLVFDRSATNRSPARLGRFLRRLRALRPELAFVLNTVSFSTSSAMVAAASGARWVVGGSSRFVGSDLTGWMYSLDWPIGRGDGVGASEQGVRALEAAGFGTSGPRPLPRVVPGPTAEAEATHFLSTLGPGRPVGLHPGSGKMRNRWPADRFAAVADELLARGFAPWILEGPADEAATRGVLAAMDGPAPPVLRNVDLCVAAAAMAKSAAVLVNDSGPMHMAAAAGARVLALFGPTPASIWAPPHDHVRALQSPDGRMESLDVDEVVTALHERIGRER